MSQSDYCLYPIPTGKRSFEYCYRELGHEGQHSHSYDRPAKVEAPEPTKGKT